MLSFFTSSARAYGSEMIQADTLMTDSIREIVVTAKELRHASSASLIGREAMKHLQPSSFSDLLELLPGGHSKDPEMGRFNAISLREAAGITQSADYSTSSLGTSFIVDGVPLMSGGTMQSTPDASQAERAPVGKGVDMRSLSTDDIEQIEIVRGIASVEYGELTSGVVNIKRKRGVSRLEARFKADTQSSLFYLGKGFALSDKWTLNAGVSWLDSKVDPRNDRENFKRINASVRSDKRWGSPSADISWNSSVNYIATFEHDDADPDLTVNNTVDSYRSDNHFVSWNNNLTLRLPASRVIKGINFVSGISYGSEQLVQQKHVASSRIMPLPISTTAGSNDVGYLPMLYLADYKVDGRPLEIFTKGTLRMLFTANSITSQLKVGLEWKMNKNYGDGPVYDLHRPLNPANNSRPRKFSVVPAIHQQSGFLESENKLYLGRQQFTLTVGVRETSLLNLDSRYYLHNHICLDPRANLVWNPSNSFAGGYPISWELAVGAGYHTKMPVAAYLYPEPLYTDIEQLNYYHNEERFRVMNVMTYVEDMTNYSLRAARNLKWEVRGDVSYRGNRLSVTYFRERMNDGFRNSGFVHLYNSMSYDASGYDPYSTGTAPAIEDLPFSKECYMAVRNKITNGSRTLKEGVEYSFQSLRLSKIHTRLTVTGAWFRTTHSNSQALWYKPSVIVNNRELQYVGLYNDTDGSRYESLNTNFLLDTDLPRLNLNFSIGVQNLWFTSRQTLYREGVPVKYMTSDGSIHPYNAEELSDPYLSQLIRVFSPASFDKMKVPSSTTINFKATKSFWKERISLAVYVNRLLTIEPDYQRYGVTIRRYSSPYFGMELNMKI